MKIYKSVLYNQGQTGNSQGLGLSGQYVANDRLYIHFTAANATILGSGQDHTGTQPTVTL